MKANAPLKLMYLNPVGTDAYDAVFADMARTYKQPGTEVHITCLADPGGSFTHIEYRAYETIVSRGIIQATRQAAREGFDALAIGCFYDTGLHDAREISGEMIVTAPCLASCEIAASLANRFGIIVGRRKWVNQMNAVAREHGYGERLSGFYHVELGVNDFQTDHAETERRLVAAGAQGGGGGLRRGADPRLHAGDRLLPRGGKGGRCPRHRPLHRGDEARGVRREPQAPVRLGAEPHVVLRAAAGGGDRALRRLRRMAMPSPSVSSSRRSDGWMA